MPQLPAANIDSKGAATSFVDARGKRATVRADNLPTAATEAQVVAYQNAIGTLSNAAVFKQVYKSESEASITALDAYDEAESSVTTGANMLFQNSVTLATKSFRVPAISLLHVDLSGNFLKDPADDADVQTAVTAILTMLGGSWAYAGSTISTYSKGVVQGVERPNVVEP